MSKLISCTPKTVRELDVLKKKTGNNSSYDTVINQLIEDFLEHHEESDIWNKMKMSRINWAISVLQDKKYLPQYDPDQKKAINYFLTKQFRRGIAVIFNCDKEIRESFL
jgi:hypothetical protein